MSTCIHVFVYTHSLLLLTLLVPTQDTAVNLVRDVFTSAGERDIYTGDSVYIAVITADGIENLTHPLRRCVVPATLLRQARRLSRTPMLV